MNEKFLSRGKRKDNGEWVTGYYVPVGDKYHYICTGMLTIIKNVPTFEHFYVIPETAGRCTGLTDKNGKMIFEGDVVKGVVLSSEFIGDIVWIEEIASFGIGHRGKREPTAWENSSLFKRLRLGYKDQFAAEIIGNIHDNPELIGGTK